MKRVSLNRSKIILFLVAILILGFGFILFQKISSQKARQFQPYQKIVSLQRKWDFKAFDRNGLPLENTTIGFSLVDTQKTNQIYVKNKPVRTTSDKAFLVLALELKNDTQQRVYFYSSDFVRLFSADGKKFEADFKNPRIEIAPLSTKKDKLAFLVEANKNDFQIQIGEVSGEKEILNLSF